jgi:hypothetical protein
VANEVEVKKQMNHFSVKCCPGEYSRHCLLKQRENDKSTGIIGHVPRFSAKNYISDSINKEYIDNGMKHTVRLPYLREVGMDF